MLEKRGEAAICSDSSPTIVKHTRFGVAHVDHRLNGKCHASHQPYTPACIAISGYLGFFVQLPPNSVTGEIPNHSESVRFGAILQRKTDITESVPDLCSLNGFIEGRPCSIKQFLGFRVQSLQQKR